MEFKTFSYVVRGKKIYLNWKPFVTVQKHPTFIYNIYYIIFIYHYIIYNLMFNNALIQESVAIKVCKSESGTSIISL